jgi:hypothetical protein
MIGSGWGLAFLALLVVAFAWWLGALWVAIFRPALAHPEMFILPSVLTALSIYGILNSEPRAKPPLR